MDYRTILVAQEGPLAVITLNRPDARNALNGTMVSELVDAFSAFEKDDSIRCVVITGDDKAFCAGADIREMIDRSAVDMVKTDHFRVMWEKVGRCPKPIVAALSGYVLGGGLELAMCCDVLIAAEGTKLGQPEINIGVIPGGGGTQRLTRALGKYKAMEMVLTGGMITAEDARDHGLVTRVVPQGQHLQEAKKVALDISSKGAVAVKLAKRAVNKALECGLAEGLDYERQLFFMLFSTQDKVEGMKAFLEKRRPEFKGT